MDFQKYQKQSFKTALPIAKNLNYMVLGLTGEAGEIANKVKKIIRDDKDIHNADLISELGDVLWYIAGICNVRGISLECVARKNIEKLFDRKKRNVIKGSGDYR